MSEPKTKATNKNPRDFLKSIEPEQKRLDGFTLLEMFERVTHQKPVMWGESMIGFGKYHYKSERSSQEGDWFQVGFSPRKQNLSLYIMHGNKNNNDFQKLGKHKKSIGCLYINKLSDVDLKLLERIIEQSYKYSQNTTYEKMVSDFHEKS